MNSFRLRVNYEEGEGKKEVRFFSVLTTEGYTLRGRIISSTTDTVMGPPMVESGTFD